MIWIVAGGITALYLFLWPFSIRVDARLSPVSARAEIIAASLFRLRLEGDLLQPPFFRLWRLDGQGRRRPLGGGGKKKKSGFSPVLKNKRLTATLYVGAETDGALTVEALGLLYALLETLGNSLCEAAAVRPVPCFDKTICALRISGIGRFILAQNILEYLKGKHTHAKR